MTTPQLKLDQAPQPTVETWYICPFCHQHFATEELCRQGFAFVPYDPLPLGTRVRRKGKQGVVKESKIVFIRPNSPLATPVHKHLRGIVIRMDSGITHRFHITEEDDFTAQEYELDPNG